MNVFRCVLFIICMISTCTAQEIGMALQCPDFFHDGENIIICKINITAIKVADCKLKYDYVMFEWNDNIDKTSVCRSVYNTTVKCATGDKHSPDSCWCAESSGEVFTYKYSYLANSTRDKGRWLTCALCFHPQKHLNVIISDGCKNMTFADSKLNAGVQSNKMGLIIGTVIGLLGVILFIIIIIIMKKFQCSHFRKNNKITDTESGNPLNPIPEEEKKSNRPKQNGHSSVPTINGI